MLRSIWQLALSIWPDGRCGPSAKCQLLPMWKSCESGRLTGAAAERYFKQVSRTGRFALVVDLHWTESAPLRRKRDSVFDN